ncbi:MAG TPA: BON domain-containing protein [Bryobacterales bacterium]|jgi:osmotically-inducible protein OsmY|nr:BON domain-containing protein [Bryobacterales bacterium]
MRTIALLLTLPLWCHAVLAAAKQPLTDDVLYDRVIRALVNDRDLKTNSIEVSVKDRVVTLRGVIDSEKLRQRAERVAQKVDGVKKVINELRVRP